jgi:hypothetical protein
MIVIVFQGINQMKSCKIIVGGYFCGVSNFGSLLNIDWKPPIEIKNM